MYILSRLIPMVHSSPCSETLVSFQWYDRLTVRRRLIDLLFFLSLIQNNYTRIRQKAISVYLHQKKFFWKQTLFFFFNFRFVRLRNTFCITLFSSLRNCNVIYISNKRQYLIS